MRRLALLSTLIGGVVVAAAGCSDIPVQPTTGAAAVDRGVALGATSTTTPSCENLIYPYTLCSTSYPNYRPALCAALRGGGTISNIPYGSRRVDAKFVRMVDPTGAQETARTYYPDPRYPTSTMTFPLVTQEQIESGALCALYK